MTTTNTNRTTKNLTDHVNLAEFYLQANRDELGVLDQTLTQFHRLWDNCSIGVGTRRQRALYRRDHQDSIADRDTLRLLHGKITRLATLVTATQTELSNWERAYGMTVEAVLNGEVPPQMTEYMAQKWPALSDAHDELLAHMETIVRDVKEAQEWIDRMAKETGVDLHDNDACLRSTDGGVVASWATSSAPFGGNV